MVGGQQQCIEESAELVDGQRDQACRRGCGFAFDRGGHGQEGMGEHGQGGPAIPGAPAPDLVLVEADLGVVNERGEAGGEVIVVVAVDDPFAWVAGVEVDLDCLQWRH